MARSETPHAVGTGGKKGLLTSPLVEVLRSSGMKTRIDADTPVAHLDDIADGPMKMVKVDGRRVCLVRTSSGVRALDHACPHEGYGLTQDKLDGESIGHRCRRSEGQSRMGDGADGVHHLSKSTI